MIGPPDHYCERISCNKFPAGPLSNSERLGDLGQQACDDESAALSIAKAESLSDRKLEAAFSTVRARQGFRRGFSYLRTCSETGFHQWAARRAKKRPARRCRGESIVLISRMPSRSSLLREVVLAFQSQPRDRSPRCANEAGPFELDDWTSGGTSERPCQG